MSAKIFSKLMLMLAIALTTLPLLADSKPQQDSTPTNGSGTGVLDLQKGAPDIKRMPSRNHLEVVYENGMLTLFSDSYEGEFSVYLVNEESGEEMSISSICIGQPIAIYLHIAEYSVTAVSMDGMTFIGYMEISY